MELLCLIRLFASFLLLSAHHAVAATSYYIDCGTASTTTDNSQSFTGDSSLPTGVQLNPKGSTISSASNSNQSIYSTARAFTSAASYQFDTSDSGTYLLRLHFSAFSSDLSSAQFDVSANGHMLLTNFSGSRNSSSAVSWEFLIPIQTGDGSLRVYFVLTGSSKLAFVNAIEAIPARLNLTDVDSPIMVTPDTGYNGSFARFGSHVLTPIYRINVGGILNVSSSADALRRVWWRDASYLINGGPSTTKNTQGVGYQSGNGNATKDTAPLAVYSTARGWDRTSDSNAIHNATWSFRVSKSSSQYFVRVHLCDIFSQANGEISSFDLRFFSNFVWNVSAFEITNQNAAPFCLDFVVKSDDLGFINLTIGSIKDIDGAFLNGLEIMEFVNGNVTEPIIPGKGPNVVLIACVAAAGFAVICLVVAGFVWFMMRKRKRAKPVEEFDWPVAVLNGGGESSESKTTSDKSASRSSLASLPSLKLRIPIGVIQQVTNNFDEALVVGQGGFGKVYKGTRKNGQKVAVKRSDERHGQGISEFQTEITVLSRIRHRHLVSLIGYCDEGGEMILVYEFMEKGTLRDHLYRSSSGSEKEGPSGDDEPKRLGLSWKQRLEICMGAAKGLHYLHTGLMGGIIHRDVKSTNILLDENFVAKVADFGLSRTGALEQDTHVSTVVKGTFGYLDPEYYQCMQLTEKSDVYSFGVLLLEVLCARLVLDPSLPRDQVNLADWAMSCKERGELETIIDPSLAGQINPNSLKKFVETAEKCLMESGADRPPMSDVLWDLEYTLNLQKLGGQGAGFGDTTSTTDASFNLPMLAVPGFSSTGFSIMEEAGFSMDDDVSGLCGDSGEVSMGHSKLDDSMSFPN